MELVKCDHCGLYFDIKDTVPCTWEEFNLTWYYCKKCNKIFIDNKVVVKNSEAIETMKINDKEKKISINNKLK